VARSIEHLLIDAPIENPPIGQLKELLKELKQCLQSPVALEVLPATPSRLLLVIGCETSFTQLLKQEAEQWGMEIEVVGDRPTMLHRIASTAPSAVLVNLSNGIQSNQLALLKTLKTEFPMVPLFGLTDAAVARSLMTLAKLGIYQCFSSTTPPKQVLQAIARSISAAQVHHPTVLMLDDDPLILQKMSNLLLPQGIQVMCLMQPQQFWNMFNAVSPDVLLLDLEMPLCHGLDICKTLRQNPKLRDLPIIVVTAHTDEMSVKAAFDVGATDVVGKPLVPEVLIAGVKSQIARSRQPALTANQPNTCAAVNSSFTPSNTGMRSPW
jgi:DNA-binding response OmpR family regulator